ncbi:hypothetical protein AB1K84_21990 [Mesobacillus foraminis]|jgi:hypothetical protein|uniref:Uncharacterized protein n=1 Tax=Mesobacillus foraminis TaxID=279826 RepID=A0A4R2BNQ5_9BACI|nr:hypothetical protein [Mesobacillus foraminis]MBT2759529.1 hypothetical protein [Mesobacillus foraminis]TCN28142.1 hypothetical protein EV146_101473 [Mesobacillus foraminis]
MMNNHELPKNYVAENSSMAVDEEEIKNLGKQMENRRTGEVLKQEYNKVPDPQQYQESKE